jgi:hypothetical protein
MFVDLPYSLVVNGEERAINCDFRDIILICNAFNDPELTNSEKTLIMLNNLYVDDWLNFGNVEEAIKQASWFIDWGKEYKETTENSPKIMDWEQDYNLIISAVNNKANVIDVRELEFVHWWTFLGYFSDRGECQFSSITDLRDKIAKGKKLDTWEKEIIRENRDQIILKNKNNTDFEKELWG